MLSRIDEAIAFATKAHDGQYRKASGIPYIAHPYSVGMLLLQTGCKEDVIIAGLLHDTVEDTKVTIEEIEREFGQRVAQLVLGSSEPDKSASWEERKQHTIETIKELDKETCLVVCADKCHNVQSIYNDYLSLGEEVWVRFNRGKEKQAWYYQNMLKALKNRLGDHSLVEKLDKTVQLLFT